MHVGGWRSEVNVMCLPLSLPTFSLETGSLTDRLDWLSLKFQWPVCYCPPPPPQHWSYRCTPPCSAYTFMLGNPDAGLQACIPSLYLPGECFPKPLSGF